MIILKLLVSECNAWKSQQTVEKNSVAKVQTNSHPKEEFFGHVQQKSPRLYPYFYSCPIVLWIFLQLGIMSIMKEKWPGNPSKFLFYGPEKAIKLAKK